MSTTDPDAPPGPGALWRRFLVWAGAIPVLALAVWAVTRGSGWLLGSDPMMPRSEMDLFYIQAATGLLLLAWPRVLWFLIGDLRDGLRRHRDWPRMTPEERQADAAARRAAAEALLPRSARRRRGRR